MKKYRKPLPELAGYQDESLPQARATQRFGATASVAAAGLTAFGTLSIYELCKPFLFPNLTIRLALEVDYLPGGEDWIRGLAARHPWDYFIGSVHYVSDSWAIDDP